jgi:hypothetical protein
MPLAELCALQKESSAEREHQVLGKEEAEW